MRWCKIPMAAGLVVLAACAEETPDAKLDPEVVARGEALFSEHCAECHPRTGRGDYLKHIPITLLARRSDEELINWIAGTENHREMPFFTHLTDEERAALASFLRNEITK